MRYRKLLSHRFARDLILVLTVLTAAVMGPVIYFSLQAKRDISKKYIHNAADNAAAEFQSMMESMGSTLEMLRGWYASKEVSLEDSHRLNQYLFPVLKSDRMLFGISVADTNGNSYYVAESGDGWRTSETGNTDSVRFSKRRVWNAGQQEVTVVREPSQYDPRSRPWFFPALSAKSVFWTEPYVFYNRQEVGITASIRVKPVIKEENVVFAADILLDDLFDKIHRMTPSDNSRVFIFRRDAQLYLPRTNGGAPEFKSIEEVKDQLIKRMYALWTAENQTNETAFSVRQDDGIWWGGFRPLEETTRNIWIGVMVPETDITGGVNQRLTILWTVGILVALIAGGGIFWMIRRYAHSFDDNNNFFDYSSPEKSLRKLVLTGEGNTVEFKSTMRMNLHTRKPGKEIEIAWLKATAAFMNTRGGILLIGVADNGEITGLENDRFDNEDKCKLHFKNLINQHLGAELSKYLNFTIVTVDEKAVGIVVCQPSMEPVFLKSGKKEAFYIRNGPSSEELPVSKVLTYIQNRK